MTQISDAQVEAVIRAGCTAGDAHLICSYPNCKCTQTPRIITAALEASEALRNTGWQPIESAPKDGTLFLSYWGNVPVFCFAEPNGKTFRVAMLSRDGKFGVHGNYAPFIPHGWQPLPASPPPITEGESSSSISPPPHSIP